MTAADTARASEGTVVTGVIGDDVHVIGLRLMEYALRQSGFKVVSLGPLASRKEFIDAAIETAADAIFISSLNGHAEIHMPGFRGACIEAGIGDILIYVGGHLTIGRPEWSGVEQRFKGEFGVDRAYPPDTRNPEIPINDLKADLRARREKRSAPVKGGA